MSELVEQLQQHAGGMQHRIFDDAGNVILDAQKPSDEEFRHSYVAPGMPALLPAGIAYYGPWKFYADGLGQHCRESIKAFASTGLPLRLQSIGSIQLLSDELHDEVRKVEYLERVSFGKTLFSIKQFVFSSVELVRELICPKMMRTEDNVRMLGGSTILYTSWERDRVFPAIIEELQHVARLWVPCKANKLAFTQSGLPEHKVHVIPYPYDPSEHTIAAPRGSKSVPEGLRFYHIGKWEPRKNQHQLLGAFLQAFSPLERASLFIKTSGFGSSWTNYPNPDESLAFWLKQTKVKEQGWDEQNIGRLVRIVAERVSEEDIRKIHQKNNIYVSSALGEAWDIPAFEAKLAGNRMVYVGFGGPEDYAQEGDVRVEHGMGHVHPGYGWEPGAEWAKVKTEDFVLALKKAEPPKSRVVPPSYCSRFSHATVGSLMWASLFLDMEQAVHDRLWSTGGFG